MADYVYRVRRLPPEGRKAPYYGTRNKRVYDRLGHVTQFMRADETSAYVVERSEVKWEEIECPSTSGEK